MVGYVQVKSIFRHIFLQINGLLEGVTQEKGSEVQDFSQTFLLILPNYVLTQP